jgi:RimJ/RimL family protein N-acetyltransferase
MRATPALLPSLRTRRLALRAFRPGDLEDLCRLDTDARVMRYVGDGKPARRPEIAAVLQRILRYPRVYPGLGCWHATRRDTGAFIGWFILKYCGDSCDVEIGYRLLPAAWGKGFATEGATTLVRHGFEALELDRIIGVTHPDNIASQRVLMKAGLADAGWGRHYGRRLRLFAARRFDFSALRDER